MLPGSKKTRQIAEKSSPNPEKFGLDPKSFAKDWKKIEKLRNSLIDVVLVDRVKPPDLFQAQFESNGDTHFDRNNGIWDLSLCNWNYCII